MNDSNKQEAETDFETDENLEDEVDLDEFSEKLFNPQLDEEEEKSPEEEEIVDEDDEQEEESEEIEDDPLATEESDEDDDDEDQEEEEVKEEPEPSLAGSKKKNSFQERINELVREREEERRQRIAIEERLKELEQKETPDQKTSKREPLEASAPTPDDKDENGELRYPLGEYDPSYIRDLTRFTIRTEREAEMAEETQRKAEAEKQEAMTALVSDYETRLKATEVEIPDIREKGAVLENTFRSVDPEYGTFLATTIMSLSDGPRIIAYLSDNLEEAQQIVNSGPAKAALALGELNGLLKKENASSSATTNKTKPKVSKAPVPPAKLNKGTKASKHIAPDTDDLDAFEKLLYNKK